MQPDMQYEQDLIFAQKIDRKKLTYSVKEDLLSIGTRATVYRRLKDLVSLGIITKANNGRFIINNSFVISQSVLLFEKLIPSLRSLKNGRRFGRYRNARSDLKFAEDIITNNGYKIMTTLDFKAWKLTKYQYPLNLYIYVNDIDSAVNLLKNNKFNERRRKRIGGREANIILLPPIGDFTNEIQRVYFDSIANGGRSINDAIAIELLYGNKLEYKGNFDKNEIESVRENLSAVSEI